MELFDLPPDSPQGRHRRRLLKRVIRAGSLRGKGVIDDVQFAAVGVEVWMTFLCEPLQLGSRISPLAFLGLTQLAEEEGFKGPPNNGFPGLGGILTLLLPPETEMGVRGFEWREDAAAALKEGRRRLRPGVRFLDSLESIAAFVVERWPSVVKGLVFVASLGSSFLLGRCSVD